MPLASWPSLIIEFVFKGLLASGAMFWSMLWALVLGFFLSGVILSFVPKKKVAGALGHFGVRELALATFLGALSSSCSYAAAAMAKSLFQKGANIVCALGFLLASTNLVVELSLVILSLMGWQFLVAEFLGGVILVFIMAVLMKAFVPIKEFELQRSRLNDDKTNSRESKNDCQSVDHEELPQAVASYRTLEGWQRVIDASFSEWRMVWKDIALGVLLSGFLMVLVPRSVWRFLFLQNQTGNFGGGLVKLIENALLGPLVSIAAFVCSVGNIPMANVLYRSGIGFGGTLSFIYADLIIVPLLLIYKKYFGWKLAVWVFVIFYASMACTGVVVDILFRSLHWVPDPKSLYDSGQKFFAINSTFWLNLAALCLIVFMIAIKKWNLGWHHSSSVKDRSGEPTHAK